MTVINLDQDERFQVNQVEAKFNGKEYVVNANDDTIKKVVKSVKEFFANAKTYDDTTKQLLNVDKNADQMTTQQMNQTIDDSVEFAAKQSEILVKAINSLFNSNLGTLLYEKYHSTKMLSDFYDQVMEDLYEKKALAKSNSMKKFIKKPKKAE